MCTDRLWDCMVAPTLGLILGPGNNLEVKIQITHMKKLHHLRSLSSKCIFIRHKNHPGTSVRSSLGFWIICCDGWRLFCGSVCAARAHGFYLFAPRAAVEIRAEGGGGGGVVLSFIADSSLISPSELHVWFLKVDNAAGPVPELQALRGLTDYDGSTWGHKDRALIGPACVPAVPPLL